MTSPDRPTLGVGLIGYAFMGAAHSHAFRTAPTFSASRFAPERAFRAAGERAKVPEPPAGWAWASTGTTCRRS